MIYNKKKLSSMIKRGITLSLAVVCVMQTLLSTVDFAKGASNYSLLGSNKALGSPLLDPSFSLEDWNKWEMMTWGIFLSNFAVPLVDDYDSAFNVNSTVGSKGSGLKALQFGSGSDPTSKETISGLLNYAVTQQQTAGLKEIYVGFSEVKRDGITKVAIDPASGATVRPATFKDMFLASSKDDGDSWVELGNVTGLNNSTNQAVPIDGDSINNTAISDWAAEWSKAEKYVDITTINAGSLPTFYTEYGTGSYEEVFDYTNSWDAQLLTAWIARVACGDFSSEFKDTFNDMWSKSADLKLYLDCFGNIVVQYNGARKIVMPASANQHLTSSPKINLVSSMMFNGLTSGLSGSEVAIRGQQSISGWFGADSILGLINTTDVRFGGLPALGSHVTGLPQGMISMYYDLDSIEYNTYFHGGTAANGTKTVQGETAPSTYNTHYGKAVKQLFDLDASKESGNEYMIKLEAANMDKFDFAGFTDKKAGEALSTMLSASGQIVNIANGGNNAKVLSKIKTDKGEQSLFDKPVIVPVQMNGGRTDNNINNSGVGRLFMNYLYEAYKGEKNSKVKEISKDYVNTILNMADTATMKDFKDIMLGIKDEKVSLLLADFVAERTDLFKLNVDAEKLYGATLGDKKNPFGGIEDTKVDGKSVASILFKDKEGLDYFPGRLIKAYPVSEVMRSVGNILGVREGTEFSLYSTYIYMTYLDWYGIKMDKLTGTMNSDFNTHIFDGSADLLKVDISTLANVKTEEEKKSEVLNYTYMMLNPTEGKEYRNEMMNSYINNFVYDNYQKIVYGNATSYYSSNTSNLATRNASGFLSLDTYSENFMTSWFIGLYSKAAIMIIGLSLLAIIIVGLLKGRQITWFILALTVVVNTVLLVPSTGELTPLVANNFVQSMFKDKMTYWGISEAVTNATMEADYVNNTSLSTGYLSSLSQEEQSQVVSLVKNLNTVYLDRELMVKNDISKKVTQTQSGNYAEIQKLRSARWMLPMIMRQFTANDGSANYVYVPLGDVYDDLSNMYWYYNPTDADYSNTIAGQQQTVSDGSTEKATTGEPLTVADRKKYYSDYKDTTSKSGGATIDYRSEAYSEGKSLDDLSHTYFYLLQSDATPLGRTYGFGGEYEGKKSYKNFVENSNKSNKAQSFISTSTALEQQAGSYDRGDRSTVKQAYGYLWSTENPYHYFYQTIKDTFAIDSNLGAIVGKLQGQYNKNDDGTEVRTSFMHSGETGYVKDVLDLQEMFTNMLPYMYEMQITAGGLDGTSGVLGDKKIEDYSIYTNNYKSWLFRSNWATKIMESPDLTRKAIVKDSSGNRIEIENPTLISCYPTERPMIFSEAQMMNEGLSEGDLNIVELKAIKINKETSRRWTMLLNYANVEGMTKEVLLRQMATDSIIAFNTEYSPSGGLSSAYKMYPDGLELRAISFDSVMKMLMLNITKDTSYIYGDTMQNIVSDSDIISSLLLITTAFLCSFLIPLIRNITMGLIFYLGFLAIIYALISSTKQKIKVSCGYLISNFIFLGLTLAYYLVFSMLMAVTTSDAVLSVQSVRVSTGNPVWCFIIIIVVSLCYILAMFKMIDFCFKHYRDMGMEVYTSVAGLVTDSLSGGFSGIMDRLTSSTGGEGSPTKESKIKENITSDSQQSTESGKAYSDSISQSDEQHSEYDGKVHSSNDDSYDDSSDVDDINNEIEKGKEDIRNDSVDVEWEEVD